MEQHQEDPTLEDLEMWLDLNPGTIEYSQLPTGLMLLGDRVVEDLDETDVQPLGEEHVSETSVYLSDAAAAPTEKFAEGNCFDKFMDRIVIAEGHGRVIKKQPDSPQRIRAARHQDRPMNRTYYGVIK
jgi:hypothetical protein